MASILQHHNPSYAPIASRRAALPGESRACSTITKTSASVGHPFLKYDAFLFDGFGTLHDNVHARPYAAKAIEALQAAGKLVIIGSNAPHPNDDELAFLQRLGVANLATSLEYAKLNDDVPMVSIFTSGHIAREELRKPSCCYGDRPLVLGASREELGRLHPPGDQIRPVETLDEATCLMAYSSAPTTADFELAQRAGEMDCPSWRSRAPALSGRSGPPPRTPLGRPAAMASRTGFRRRLCREHGAATLRVATAGAGRGARCRLPWRALTASGQDVAESCSTRDNDRT